MKLQLVTLLTLSFFASCTKFLESEEITPKWPDQSGEKLADYIFYISSKGNNTNHGHTADSAWDLARANAYEFSPGDEIHLIDTVRGTLTLDESGTAEKPIIIQGGILESKGAHGIVLYNTSFVQVKNMEIRGSGNFTGNPKDAGIYLLSDDRRRHPGIILDGIIVKGFGLAGIYSELAMSPEVKWESQQASMAYPGGYDQMLINRCLADSNGYAGIQIGGSWPGRQNRDITIKNTRTSYNRGIKDMNPHSGNGIVLANTINGLIDSCTASYNGWEYGNANIGIWTYTAANITIQHSVAFRNKSTGSSDGGGFDIDGGTANCLMQYNLSYENDGAGYLVYEFGDPNKMEQNQVRYNIAVNNARKNKQYGGITVGGAAPQWDLSIYNNTIMQDEGKAITKIGYEVKGSFNIKNNVLSSPEAPYLVSTAAYNVYKNPLLAEDFSPLSNSPVIDAGAEIDGLPVKDFYGMPLRGKRDIGAVEY